MSEKSKSMMDDSMPEGDRPTFTNSERNVWALDTLVEEVEALFPDVTYEVSNIDPRNAHHDVQFVFEREDEQRLLTDILALVTGLYDMSSGDDRIASAVADSEGVLVSFVFNPRLQDSREPFGLADAYDVLTDEDRQ